MSHDTIGRVLMALKPSAFQTCFELWLKRIAGERADNQLDVIAIDGKALRRSHDHSAGLGPLFLASAWAVQRGISLGQLATEENQLPVPEDLIGKEKWKGMRTIGVVIRMSEKKDGRLESKLARQSPWNTNDLVCVGPGSSPLPEYASVGELRRKRLQGDMDAALNQVFSVGTTLCTSRRNTTVPPFYRVPRTR